MIATKAKCLTCPRDAQVRGLCKACHVAALRSIKSGEATERKLVEMGLILAKSQGKKSRSPFLQMLRAGGKESGKGTPALT